MQRGCIRDEYTPSIYLCNASLCEASKLLYLFIALSLQLSGLTKQIN